MFYLDIYLPDDTVEYFCSKDINLLFLAAHKVEHPWTIGNYPGEFPEADYLAFEITAECRELGKVN